MDSFESLMRTQRFQKRQLGKLTATVKDASPKSIAQWESLQITLGELKQEFIVNQESILKLVSGDEELHGVEETQYDQFVDKCMEILLLVREAIASLIPSHVPGGQPGEPSGERDSQLTEILRDMAEIHRQTSSRMGATSRPKLPELELPKFNGEYANWRAFADAFNSTVHNNCDLSAGDKMQYLKLALKGEAFKHVEHLEITDENYMELWNELQRRYGKKVHIVHDCIDKFMSQAHMKEGSLESLRKITIESKRIVFQLQKMGPEYYTLDSWIVYLMNNLMDEDTRKSWEENRNTNDLATVSEWFEFLDNRIDAMERWTRKSNPVDQHKTKPEKRASQGKGTVRTLHTEAGKCPKCAMRHELYKCDAFKQMTRQERRKFVFTEKLCYNCLMKDNHISDNCPSKYRCRVCDRKHHTLLHSDEPQASQGNRESTSPTNQEETAPEESVIIHHSTSNTRVLLPTALVNVLDSRNQKQVCRILIDGGSECNLISEACVQRLGLMRRRNKIQVNGPGEVKVGETRGSVSLVLSSIHHPEEHIEPEALVLSKLTAMLPSSMVVEPKTWKHLRTLQLADPSFNTPGNIDIILGAEFAMAINLPQIIRGNDDVPVAQLTIFGWVLGGKIGGEVPKVQSFHITQSMDDLMKRIFEVEDVNSNVKILSEEEQYCEEHFVQNVQRDSSGRYQVRMPFKIAHGELGNSKSAALFRLHSMERKFEKHPDFHEKYVEFMREYLRMGHMERVPAREVSVSPSESYYIPHMAVLRPSSTTTKLRVVFDASARTRPHKISLNDILAVGPTIQQDLVSLLLSFRTHQYAYTADVEKMYRQVLVAPEDRDYLRILWRENCDEDIQTYRLTTVTYGTACAPYLATRVLHQIAQDYEAEFPRASQEIRRGFYMDDFLGGADSLEEANQLRSEIQTILAKGGFNLRKWASNSSKILDRIPSDYQAVTPEDVAHGLKTHTVLGVAWSPGEDTLSVVDEPLPSVSTMRELCSVSAKIYDPLGMISPVTAALRILFQKLWSYSIGWDDDLPAEVLEEYNIIKEEIEFVSQVKLPRLINPSNSQIELHGFADASERGYGAVIYARGPEQDQRFVVRFLIAKSRVAPRNVVTIPRLELCAALLLSLLVQKVKQAYSSHNVTVTAWTDSQVVLHWLHGHPSRWKMFVANRTNQILEVIPASQWKHVASRDNPADCISRGMTPKALANHPLWPSGPSWLQNNSDDWPVSLPNFNNDVLTGEEKLPVTQSLVVQKTIDPNEIFLMFSDVSRLIRSVAHILRWRHKLSKGDNLNVTELDTARNQLIKVAQKECFSDEIKCLQQGRILPCGSKLSPLVPFLDSEGIVRVKGRIQNSKLDYSARHPIVLSGKHLFTLKLIEKAHQVHLHSGLTLTQSVLREKYWIIGERKSVKSVINKCVICFKAKPKGQTPQMGNLPTVRVRQARPFINTGCDFAGPFTLRASKLRKAVLVKGYLCLFICMATKAVHLEVVSDLTTDAFIAALRRFTARRGHCENIYCDNAKNFVGAAQPSDSGDVIQAVKKHRDRVVNFMAESGTQFHFIPACSPTFGGLWERGVANVKHHLRRVLSDTKLTYEEMSTVVAEIEACLNSRPLCPLSSSPDDFEALTPGHLLITQPLTMSPGPDYLAENPNRLTRWQFLQRLVQEFWKRWHSEYVTSLQPRQKWRNNEENLKIGDLVLLRSDNFKGLWTLGRISEVHPGADSIVRVVTVKTPTGTYRRAVNRLARLPIES